MDKIREIRLRNWATRLGLFLHKSRAKKWKINDHRGYSITDQSRKTIIYGQKFELDLDQVEACLKEYEAKLKAS